MISDDKDKYKKNRETYDVICFWKGDDNRSLIMKNVQNMQKMQNMQNNQNMQNIQNMQNMQIMQNMQKMQNLKNMQNMKNISPLCFSSRREKQRSLNQNQVSTRGPV